MSDPLHINAGKNGSVGTATIAAATDLFTITAHGLADGDTVTVDTLTGGAVGVLVVDAVYFVRDATADTFGVALTRGGALVQFASDGGADVYRFAPQYHAQELRRAMATLLTPGVADRFGARAGVRPGGVDAVTLSGTTWTVQDVNAVVYPGLTALSGPYLVQFPEASDSLQPADASNDRIDAIDMQVQDNDEDASGFRRFRPVYVVGAPAGTPTAPPLTANSFRAATFLVPSGGTPPPTITYVAPYTVALGGTLPARNATELPSVGTYDGMMAWRQDTRELVVDDGSGTGWEAIATAGGWTRIASGFGFSGAEIDIDLTAGGRFPAGTFDRIRIAARGSMTGLSIVRIRINSDASTIYNYGLLVWNTSDATIANTAATAANAWGVAEWGTAAANNLLAELYHTHEAASISFSSSGVRTTSPPHVSSAGGHLSGASLLPSSVQLVGTGQDFSGTSFWVEGYRD